MSRVSVVMATKDRGCTGYKLQMAGLQMACMYKTKLCIRHVKAATTYHWGSIAGPITVIHSPTWNQKNKKFHVNWRTWCTCLDTNDDSIKNQSEAAWGQGCAIATIKSRRINSRRHADQTTCWNVMCFPNDADTSCGQRCRHVMWTTMQTRHVDNDADASCGQRHIASWEAFQGWNLLAKICNKNKSQKNKKTRPKRTYARTLPPLARNLIYLHLM